ncbi:spore germination protein [Candidatus Soleaferrea massiliensis]|uniref:spore germination protein n=1 Tax=Candidatus Soleaferrea massiliensis TaxID=1470354 RepID=UPI00058B1F9D|nr:spore germination protein [Candidatus Soleaferrea massiliensis]
MFQYIKKVLKHLKNKKTNDEDSAPQSSQLSLSLDLNSNLDTLRKIFSISSDIVIREFAFGQKPQIHAALIYVDGLVDKATINQSIIKPLMYDSRTICSEETHKENIDHIKTTLLSVGEVKQITSINKLVDGCMSGDTILLINGFDEALVMSTRAWETRGVQEPQTENVVRGPREGFSETLRINTSLLRRKIKNPDLILETMKIGNRTKTDVCIAYLNSIVNPALIDEIKRRLNRINTDAILESGYIEQFIEDAPYSIFATVANSEKPDVVAAKILEGRAAIFIDGTPFVLTVPMLFVESFQTSEDYYSRTFFSSIIRILRYVSYMITILTPGVYVAVLAYHPELIPTPLMFTLMASEEGLPFPLFLELFVMVLVFDILREAGVRLPRPVGQAVSIVGALVIGEAAVAAGIVSDFTVIVIAITAVSSFVIPAQTDSASMLRYILLILGGVMGGYGIIIGLICALVHLATLRSFGTPYLSPLAPLVRRDLKDTFIRVPIWGMATRPEDIGAQESKRQSSGLKPTPPPEEENQTRS